MVKADLLYQLNLRLQEVKQNLCPFGGVSVLLFGDLMQLQPVRARWIFQQPKSEFFGHTFEAMNLWEMFTVIELTKNHRQGEDGNYAGLLNRVRFGSHTSQDIATLLTRIELNLPEDCLYVYGTNNLVNKRNQKMLARNPNISYTFKASHNHPSIPNYKPYLKNGNIGDTPFQDELILKKGCIVMIIYNIDTADSLTNGSMGKIEEFRTNSNGIIEHVLLSFEDPKIGKHTRNEKIHLLPNHLRHCVPIPRVTFSYAMGKGRRGKVCNVQVIQFPLKLSFAITAHKIQGQTVRKPNKMVADLKSVFTAGQAYVILSRVQSLEQLVLSSFSEKKITTDKYALEESVRMKFRSLNNTNPPYLRNLPGKLKIATLNIRSLRKHLPDLVADEILLHSDFICLTETHVCENNFSHLSIPGYKLYHAAHGKGKGVAIYCKQNPKNVFSYVSDLFQILALQYDSFDIVCIYRSTGHNETLQRIYDLLCDNLDLEKKSIISGDFNFQFNRDPDNIFVQLMKSHDYEQKVKCPTHIAGNILDHVYVKQTAPFEQFLHPVYYSDHDCLLSILN
jgi:hypothetical protein